MAIPIKNIKERCCDTHLTSYSIINVDCLDDVGSTCDKVIECRDKYMLVEEKSIVLSFLHNCCKEIDKDFDSYKYENDNISYLKIEEVILLIQSMNIDTKRRILSDSIVNLISSSAKKASNTTDICNHTAPTPKYSLFQVFWLI